MRTPRARSFRVPSCCGPSIACSKCHGVAARLVREISDSEKLVDSGIRIAIHGSVLFSVVSHTTDIVGRGDCLSVLIEGPPSLKIPVNKQIIVAGTRTRPRIQMICPSPTDGE
jgi:hypothetical protein